MKNEFLTKMFSNIFKSKVEVNIIEDENEIEELVRLNQNVLNYYRKHVNGNKNISEDQARRKMTRNLKLSYKYKEDSDIKQISRSWYSYGALRFMVRDNEVVWMKNQTKVFKVWSKDWDTYKKLNKELNIEERWIK